MLQAPSTFSQDHFMQKLYLTQQDKQWVVALVNEEIQFTRLFTLLSISVKQAKIAYATY